MTTKKIVKKTSVKAKATKKEAPEIVVSPPPKTVASTKYTFSTIEPSKTECHAGIIQYIIDEVHKCIEGSRFWEDKSGFGEIFGIVPITRIREREVGSRFFPYTYRDKLTENKIVVIDCKPKSKESEKKKDFYETLNIVHISEDSANKIIETLKGII